MQEAGTSLDATTRVRTPEASDPATLICFSHLRWAFVYQRPQHLLTRAARHYRVYFLEEPVFEPISEARLERREEPGGVTVLVPFLPSGTDETQAEALQRDFLGRLLAAEA